MLHSGRASNCLCRDKQGARCPDCRHLLDGVASIVVGDELQTIESQAVKCTVCGKVVTGHSSDIVLDIQDVTQKQLGEL